MPYRLFERAIPVLPLSVLSAFIPSASRFFYNIRLFGLSVSLPHSPRLPCLFLKHLSRLWLQGFPDLGIGHEQVVLVCIIPQCKIILYLIHLRRFRNADAVLLPVYRALLDGCEHFAPAHGHGIRPQRLEELHIYLAAWHSDLQPFDIFRRLHFPLAIRDLTEAVVEGAQICNAFLFQALCVILSASPVDGLSLASTK